MSSTVLEKCLRLSQDITFNVAKKYYIKKLKIKIYTAYYK